MHKALFFMALLCMPWVNMKYVHACMHADINKRKYNMICPIIEIFKIQKRNAICLSFYLYIYRCIDLCTHGRSISICLCLSIYLSVYPWSINLFVRLSVCLSVYLYFFIHLYLCICIYLYLYTSISSSYLSVCLSINLSISQ